MVEIVPDSFRPVTNSLAPAIRFTITETAQQNHILLKAEGQILTDDDQIVANFSEISRQPSNGIMQIRGISDYQSPIPNIKHTVEVSFNLDKKSIDYIEDRRHKNSKRDVVFKVIIYLMFLSHDLQIGDYNKVKSVSGETIISAYGKASRADMNLNMITTAQGSTPQSLLRYNIANVTTTYTIRSSDWVGDFQVPLGIGRFLTIEIPQIEHQTFDNLVLNEDQKRFKERLDKAISMLPMIENELRKGEWGHVVKESRELLELFRRDVTKFIKQIVSQTTSLSEEAATAFTTAIDNHYSYANDLHHTVDKNGTVKEVFTGGKTDAQTVYNNVAGLVSQLSEKFATVVRNSQQK